MVRCQSGLSGLSAKELGHCVLRRFESYSHRQITNRAYPMSSSASSYYAGVFEDTFDKKLEHLEKINYRDILHILNNMKMSIDWFYESEPALTKSQWVAIDAINTAICKLTLEE